MWRPFGIVTPSGDLDSPRRSTPTAREFVRSTARPRAQQRADEKIESSGMSKARPPRVSGQASHRSETDRHARANTLGGGFGVCGFEISNCRGRHETGNERPLICACNITVYDQRELRRDPLTFAHDLSASLFKMRGCSRVLDSVRFEDRRRHSSSLRTAECFTQLCVY
jgi:hypothetical protein